MSAGNVLPRLRQWAGQMQGFALQQQQQQQQQQQHPRHHALGGEPGPFMEANPSESSPTRKRAKARKAQ
ncbi:hypothetical protein ACOMHN_046439 [Nucella lapillus]